MKKANANPNMIVQASGFQKIALSPPKKICGLSSENIVTKLMLNPIANGIRAEIADGAETEAGTAVAERLFDGTLFRQADLLPEMIVPPRNALVEFRETGQHL